MRDLEPGDPRRLGDHAVVGVLGTGGFGRVYAARASADRMLAAKVLHPHLLRADPEIAVRFGGVMAELSRVRNLRGGRIVQWDTEPSPWYVRHYIPGATLTELIALGVPLDAALVAQIGAQTATRLAAMHAAGVAHGAVTANNVLVTSRTVRLVDGGLIGLLGPGTPVARGAYAAPEGVDGTIAADLYALGTLLVLCARGRLPTGRDDADALPESAARTIRALLAPDPAARPPAAQVARELRTQHSTIRGLLPRELAHAVAAHRPAVWDPRRGSGGTASTPVSSPLPRIPAQQSVAPAVAVRTAAPVAPAAPPAAPRAPARARTLWRHELPGVQALFVSDGLVFAGGEEVTAMDLRTGDVRWSKPGWHLPAEPFEGRVCCTQGTRVALVDAATGREIWRTDVAAVRGLWARSTGRLARAERAFRMHTVYRPTAGVLVAVGGHSELFGLAADTGELLWNRREPRRTTFGRDGAGVVYLSGDRREPVRALDAVTGAVAWEDTTGDSIVVAVGRNHVACGRFQPDTADLARYVVHTAADGRQVRDAAPGEAAFLDDDGVLYVVGGAGRHDRFRALLGNAKWTLPWRGTAGITVAPSGDEAYLRNDTGKVYAIDLVGRTVRWVSEPPRRIADPVGGRLDRALAVTVDDDLVYVRCHGDPALVALDRADGRERWHRPALYGTFTMVDPAAESGRVCVVADDTVMALTAPDGA